MMASRVVAMGSTMEYTGPALSNQGRQVTAQLKPNWVSGLTIEEASGEATETVMAWSLNDEPVDVPHPESLFDFLRELSEADPNSVAGAAHVGAYFVHKMNEPTLLFKKHLWQHGTTDTNKTTYASPFTAAYQGITTANINETNSVEGYAEPYAWNAAIYWGEGLSIQASFQLKLYSFLEGQITPRDNFKYYAHKTPDADPQAQEIYQIMVANMPSSFPSKANAFGWLKKAWNWTKKAVGKGLGFIKPFTPALDAVMPGLGTALGKGEEVMNILPYIG
jgi:hypothetical protein